MEENEMKKIREELVGVKLVTNIIFYFKINSFMNSRSFEYVGLTCR